jgi:7-keto-8-aminopelargonate synthetase-like enzyme
MKDKIENLTLEEKKALLKKLREGKEKSSEVLDPKTTMEVQQLEVENNYDSFLHGGGAKLREMEKFNAWVNETKRQGKYSFEIPRLTGQDTLIKVAGVDGSQHELLNFSSYNYLGLGFHPEVIQAAKDALDTFGLGANSSPVISGTLEVHSRLEEKLLEFWSLEGYGVSLFSSGYGVNLGVIQAFVKPGDFVVLDKAVHMSIVEGAQLSGANIRYFEHNSESDLEEILQQVADGRNRILVCVEGVYSAEGNIGRLSEIVPLAKNYGAYVLVDEAHSVLIAGRKGRGILEEQDILDQIDLYVITFSKSFSGVGGAVIAKRSITQYVNWFAKCRMFSCALDPAVTAGITKSLELAMGEEGDKRRERIHSNSRLLRGLLKDKVNVGLSESWIVPVIYGDDQLTLEVNHFLHLEGLDTSIMQYPAVPKNEARIRMFVTSEHRHDQIHKAADVILKAAERFSFHL